MPISEILSRAKQKSGSQHAEALRNFKTQIRVKTITFSAQVRESIICIVYIASYTILRFVRWLP